MRALRKYRKLIKLLVLFLIPVLLYGAIKLAIWYSTQQALENLSRQLAGFVEFKYQSISSSIKGSVSVNGVTVFVPMVRESIEIKTLRLSTDNVITLLTLSLNLKSEQPPNTMAVLIEGLAIDVNSKLLATPADKPQTAIERLNTLACGNINRFSGDVLQEMGYSRIKADFNIDYQYDVSAKTLHLNFYENVDGFFSVDLAIQVIELDKLPGVDKVGMNMANPQLMPKLGKIQLTLEDDTFINRKINLCSKNNKSNQADYIAKHVAMVDNYFRQMGILLHSNLLQGYKTTLMHPGNVILSMDLSAVDNVMELANQSPDEIIAQSNIKLMVNNKPIEPVSIQIDQQVFNQNSGDNVQQIKVYDPNVKPVKVKKFHPIAIVKLAKYDKYPVKITTKSGKLVKGQLSVKTPREFEVVSRVHGGEMGLYIKIAEIKSAEVFY